MVDLYWIPLGAGGHCVRLTGLAYRACTGRELYHAALIVDDHAIEVAPSWDANEASRGVVATGAVGSRLLDAVASVPTPVWGRDELGAGEMWNSNSMVAWLIAGAGLPADLLRPPANGRAPGWGAGLL